MRDAVREPSENENKKFVCFEFRAKSTQPSRNKTHRKQVHTDAARVWAFWTNAMQRCFHKTFTVTVSLVLVANEGLGRVVHTRGRVSPPSQRCRVVEDLH